MRWIDVPQKAMSNAEFLDFISTTHLWFVMSAMLFGWRIIKVVSRVAMTLCCRPGGVRTGMGKSRIGSNTRYLY